LTGTIWAVIALVIVGAVVAFVASRRRTEHPANLGVVSHQWLAEHKIGPGQDWRR
jgi:hypothetical protein